MKVLCVGSNYVHHVREMGGVSAPREPVWFWKPESAVIADGESIVVPEGIGEVHHEVELAIRIGSRARRVDAEAARSCLDAFTVAVDVTARDLQKEAKATGRPWAMAKGFDSFLPLGSWQDAEGVDLQDLRLRLTVNGHVRQEGWTGDMSWDVAQLVAMASRWTTLRSGDVLLTGTPEGVGPIRPGDELESHVVGVYSMRNPVVSD